MKKLIAVLMIIGMVVAATPAMAGGGESVGDNPAVQKLGRGTMNILDATVEIPGTMIRMGEEKGGQGVFEGVFVGAVNMVKRAAVGVYEVVTFPFPVPADYEPILDEPQFLNK